LHKSIFISVGIYARLRGVNTILLFILGKQKPRRLFKVTNLLQRDIKEIICTISEVYQDLMRTFDAINSIYGFVVMLGCGTVWSHSVFTSFAVYKNFIVHGSLTGKTIGTLAFNIYYNLFILSIIVNNFRTRQQVDDLIKHVNELINKSKDKLTQQMLVSLQNQIEKRPPKFTCGLFDFDWKLIFTVN